MKRYSDRKIYWIWTCSLFNYRGIKRDVRSHAAGLSSKWCDHFIGAVSYLVYCSLYFTFGTFKSYQVRSGKWYLLYDLNN